MEKQEKLEQFRQEMIKSQELSQKQIEEGIKDFLTDNPMMSVIMISQKKHLLVGNYTSNVVSLARMMIQQPKFKRMVKDALRVADGDYKIIKQHYHDSEKVIKSLYEQ